MEKADLENTISSLQAEIYSAAYYGNSFKDLVPVKLLQDALSLLKAQKEWISVKDRMPAETHSIFWPWRNTAKWSNAMWAEQSDKVIVVICFKDGTRIIRLGETHDGKWHTDISKTLEPVVTHWMPFPDLPNQ